MAKKILGMCGIRPQDLRVAKPKLYHWATVPAWLKRHFSLIILSYTSSSKKSAWNLKISKFNDFSKFPRSNWIINAYTKSTHYMEAPHIVRNHPKLSCISNAPLSNVIQLGLWSALGVFQPCFAWWKKTRPNGLGCFSKSRQFYILF